VAVWDRTDQWHEPASNLYRRLLQERRSLLTTTLIFYECGNATARRPYRARVNVLRQAFVRSASLIEPTAEDLEIAWEAFERGEAGRPGLLTTSRSPNAKAGTDRSVHE
jgi:hypothetical protein